MDVVTTYKSIRNLSASLCWEDGRVEMGGWLQFGRGEMGWGRRRGRRRRNKGREEERVSVEAVYTGVYWRHHRRKYSIRKTVGDFTGVSDTSLLGCLGLNPSVFLSVNSSKKIHVIPPLHFQKQFLTRQRCRRCFSVG